MTVRDQIQAAIETLQMLLTDGVFGSEYKELLNTELPEEYMRMEVQVPATADCDAVAYIALTEECEPDEKYPDGYKHSLIKL